MLLSDLQAIAKREQSSRKKYTLRCCLAAGCVSSQAGELKTALEKAVQEAGLSDEVEVRGVGCMRLCCQGPLVSPNQASLETLSSHFGRPSFQAASAKRGNRAS